MKIAWFTPFCTKSAIGRYSKYATNALSKYADIVIYAPKTNELHQTDLPVVLIEENEEIADLKDKFDYIVYNMGDNSIYHKAIYNMMKKYAGIVILHDICMFNFFWGYYRAEHRYDEHIETLASMYGIDRARELERDISHIETRYSVDLIEHNMLEVFCKHAIGVIVHSNFHAKKVREVYKGCVAVLPLIKMCEEIKNGESLVSPFSNNRLNILTVGTVNQNKLVAEIMEAIASESCLRENICYSIVGEITDELYRKIITDIIAKNDLKDCVKIEGYKSDEELNAYYYYADVTCNLRFPVFEGGSATLQEQLINGKTAIVANTGAYTDVPDDCAIKISTENIVEDLTKKLEYILNNKDEVRKIGENGKKYAQNFYAEEKYTQGFISFITDNADEIAFNRVIYKAFDNIKYTLRDCELDYEKDKRDNRISNFFAYEAEKLFYNSRLGEINESIK